MRGKSSWSDTKAGVTNDGYSEVGGLAADQARAQDHRVGMLDLPLRRMLLLRREDLSQVLLPEFDLPGGMRRMRKDHR